MALEYKINFVKKKKKRKKRKNEIVVLIKVVLVLVSQKCILVLNSYCLSLW